MSISNWREFSRALKKSPQDFYVIHYSCQSLNDDNEGLSPRITSIVVSHYSTEQTISFSTHAIAEELKIERDAVRERFDEIELRLLSDFYAYVRDRRDKYWVHWNMRNLMYGFEHLEHRYQTLGRDDGVVIPIEHRINLNDMLRDRYGADYCAHPRMQSLMGLNGGVHRHFLTGQEEVDAFNRGEFIRMHNSTLCKVGFFHNAIRTAIQGKIRTNSKSWGVKLDKMFESRFIKCVGLFGAICTVCLAVWQIVESALP